MKKNLVLAVCLSALLVSGSAFAVSTSLGNIKVNLNTPQTTNKTTTTKTSVSATQMKNKIAALDSKIASVSKNYQNTVTDLANNLLPKDELAKLQEKTAKLKQSSKNGVEINIDIAENGTVALNNALKSEGTDLFKNLSAAKKAAIQKDYIALKNESSSYTQIAAQAKDLITAIKQDPATAVSLTPELVGLGKTSKEALTQVKNISKLTTSLTTTAAKAGVKLK